MGWNFFYCISFWNINVYRVFSHEKKSIIHRVFSYFLLKRIFHLCKNNIGLINLPQLLHKIRASEGYVSMTANLRSFSFCLNSRSLEPFYFHSLTFQIAVFCNIIHFFPKSHCIIICLLLSGFQRSYPSSIV
jgi:hypothetical protein